MSTYDMIVEEGIAQGRKEALEQATREMLLKGFEYHLIVDILHVKSEFIDKIREALLLEKEELFNENNSD